MALGNPFGLGGSVSRGILSSKNRRPPTGNEPLNIADWLQTDAAINPGNSGGPLVDLKGQLIGINVAVYQQGQGIGFAIPVREVSKALSQFFSPEVSNSKWFGAWLKGGLTPPTIAEVQRGSPADKAGLRPGMQITRVNGQLTHSLVDFSERVVAGAESSDVSLGILDAGKERTVNVKLEPFENIIKRRSGLTVQELTPQTAARLGLRDRQGVIIESIEKGSPAEKADLKPGVLITAFDNKVINEIRDLGLAMINKNEDLSAQLTLYALQSVGGPYVRPVQGKVDILLKKP
jgi:serine protease Do